MKEPDYVMILMKTYGTTELMGNVRMRAYKINGMKKNKTIVYREVVYNHFKFRDAVYTKNCIQIFPLVLEETWKMVRLPNCAF